MASSAAQASSQRQVVALVNGPSAQSLAQMSSLALAVGTASPMSRGVESTFAGVPGYGVHRFNGRVDPPTGDPSTRAITPVAIPVDVRGRRPMAGGPSSPGAYPSTGQEANYGAVAGLDFGKLSNLGMGG